MNYCNYRNPEILGKCSKVAANKSLLYPHTYPPRFILEVSAREMRNSESMTIEFIGPEKPIKITIQLLSQVQPRLRKFSVSINYSMVYLMFFAFQDGLFKAIEGSGTLIQQKVTQYFKKLMEVPHTETEV